MRTVEDCQVSQNQLKFSGSHIIPDFNWMEREDIHRSCFNLTYPMFDKVRDRSECILWNRSLVRTKIWKKQKYILNVLVRLH